MSRRLVMTAKQRAARADALRDMMRSGARPHDLLHGRLGVSPAGLRAIRLSPRDVIRVRT